jgi:hypothetical protein
MVSVVTEAVVVVTAEAVVTVVAVAGSHKDDPTE